MAQATLASTLIEVVGSFAKVAVGVAGGSGTSTVVTVPQFLVVQWAMALSDVSATAPYVGTLSTNTFTVTHASGDTFAWIAFGKAKL